MEESGEFTDSAGPEYEADAGDRCCKLERRIGGGVADRLVEAVSVCPTSVS